MVFIDTLRNLHEWFSYGKLVHSRVISLDDARGIIDGLQAVDPSAKVHYNDGSGEYVKVGGHAGFGFLEKDYQGVRGRKTLIHQLRLRKHGMFGVINLRTNEFDAVLNYACDFPK